MEYSGSVWDRITLTSAFLCLPTATGAAFCYQLYATYHLFVHLLPLLRILASTCSGSFLHLLARAPELLPSPGRTRTYTPGCPTHITSPSSPSPFYLHFGAALPPHPAYFSPHYFLIPTDAYRRFCQHFYLFIDPTVSRARFAPPRVLPTRTPFHIAMPHLRVAHFAFFLLLRWFGRLRMVYWAHTRCMPWFHTPPCITAPVTFTQATTTHCVPPPPPPLPLYLPPLPIMVPSAQQLVVVHASFVTWRACRACASLVHLPLLPEKHLPTTPPHHLPPDRLEMRQTDRIRDWTGTRQGQGRLPVPSLASRPFAFPPQLTCHLPPPHLPTMPTHTYVTTPCLPPHLPPALPPFPLRTCLWHGCCSATFSLFIPYLHTLLVRRTTCNVVTCSCCAHT